MIEDNIVNVNADIKGQKIEINNISHSVFQVVNSDDDFEILVDTGASIHIIHNSSLFSKLYKSPTSKLSYLEMADGTKCSNLIAGRGTALIPVIDSSGTKCKIKLTNCLYVPSFRKNIVSVNLAIQSGFRFHFNDIGQETMQCPQGNIFKISTKGSLYFLNNFTINSIISRSLNEWHIYLGHPNLDEIMKLPEVTDNMKITHKKQIENCETCLISKMCKNISKAPDERGNKPFAKIHIDLAGPINKENIVDGKYLFGAICDFSNFLNVYIMPSKAESHNVLKLYISQIKPYGSPVIVRTDGGGEFVSKDFNSVLLDHSIKHEYSSPYSPHMMGHIERQWRILFNCTRALLIDSNVPLTLWPYAIKYATFLRNRTYQNRIKCTPLQMATGRKPNMAKINLFGSKCFTYDHSKTNKTKLEPRALEGVFIGYDEQSPSTLVFNPDNHDLIKSNNVKILNIKFFQSRPDTDINFFKDNTNQNQDMQNEVINETPLPDVCTNSNNMQPTHYNLRGRKPTNYQENFCSIETQTTPDLKPMESIPLPYNKYLQENSLNDYYLGDTMFKSCSNINHTSILVPNTYLQAMQSLDWIEWQAAMDREFASLIAKHTWKLVKLPPHTDLIGSRWVYTIKVDPSGNITFKARFVAQGFSQRPGLNFQDTYAPTPTMTSIRLLMNIAVQEGLLCHHCDVNNAYLNANIDFDVYVKQPQGYSNDPTLVCKLNKALYGLKQAAYRWHATIVEFMISQGLKQSIMDPCVYVRRTRSFTLIILIWVDDLIIAASNELALNTFKKNFANSFLIKDLGELNWFLGIQFNITKNCISLNQSFYVQTILNRFKMNEAKPRSLPVDPSVYDLLRQPSEYLQNPTSFRELIGSLIYLMTGTRPDLAFIVTLLSRFMQTPTKMHYKLGLGVLQYLKATKHYDLKYVKMNEPLRLFGMSDSDWASDLDFQSISGSVFKASINSAAISWRSGKQSLVAASSCESEYIALFHAVSEGIFLRQLLSEFQQLPPQTVLIYGDNLGSITLAKHPAYHRKSRHINIKFHFIRKYVANKSVALAYIPSKQNLADMATKALKGPNIRNFASIRGISPE